ncbi:uncharacterized protein LOC114239769 isoform X2 [Bombyx mandarina]|uniref:Uncharacterized protein LOC114239769 isoform X2 n=1 Tax=Bombyx mandarina TaxID=7092 RepID=A0A6J2J9Z8_BOMMA|nr:uncharacterized protein LOC114239769 isoform X2 [Bombyx mandarina]
MKTMDEKLIRSVKKFPCIWKTTSEYYKCNETKDAAWDQITIETNISDVKTAKSRWKQLRDNHRDALKRQNATRSGQARKQRKEWKYQKAMSFLLPYMCNRDGSSNFVTLDNSTQRLHQIISTLVSILLVLQMIATLVSILLALQKFKQPKILKHLPQSKQDLMKNADNFETYYDF